MKGDLFKGILGFSMRAGRDTSFVVDYLREQKIEKHKESTLWKPDSDASSPPLPWRR